MTMGWLPFISLAFLLIGASCSSPKKERIFPYEEMAEGDLAFRCGHGVFSRAVTAAESDGVYSHVGIVVKEQGRWHVVHAVPGERENNSDFDRVKIEDIEEFYSSDRAFRGCLVHTGFRDSLLIDIICSKAISSARDSVRFDADYSLEDSSRVYCTEFVWRLYQEGGIDLSEGRRRFIHAFHIRGDVILPEHLLAYSDNTTYYSY